MRQIHRKNLQVSAITFCSKTKALCITYSNNKFTCSNSTMETLEKGVKYIQS